MTITGIKSDRQEPDSIRPIFTQNENGGYDIDLPCGFDWETLLHQTDTLKGMLLDAEEPQLIINELIRVDSERRTAQVLTVIISRILFSKNPRLEVDALVAALNLPFRGNVSHAEIAKSYAITREAFSERVSDIVKELGLRHPRMCKSTDTSSTYRDGNKRNRKIEEEPKIKKKKGKTK